MKIKIKEHAISPNELKLVLSEKFENKYQISNRRPDIIVVAKTKTIGALVFVKKNKIVVGGNFSTMKAQIIFTLLVVLLGFIIPIIVYFFVFHKKMKLVEKEVEEFIIQNFKELIIE